MDFPEKVTQVTPAQILSTGKAAANVPPFHTTPADQRFVFAVILLGYLFIRRIIYLGGEEWWFGYTLLFCGTVLLYALAGKKTKPTPESWFWLCMVLILGISMLQPLKSSLQMIRFALLMFSASYWIVTLLRGQIEGKTGDYLVWDFLNCFLIVPFGNFATPVLALEGSGKLLKSGFQKRAGPVLLTFFILIPVLWLVMPRLLWADEGVFSSVIDSAIQMLRLDVMGDWLRDELSFGVVAAIAWVPTALYIGGMVMGYAHKRRTASFPLEKLEEWGKRVRLCPNMTVAGVLAVTSGLYLLFIVTQIPYYFSAFHGVLPAGIDIYSEYARNGFFELCQIAGINLSLAAILNVIGKIPAAKLPLLKAANTVLMVLTLLILGTACSKMLLYIAALGLTPARIFTLVVMTWLASVCIAVILRQWRQFSLGRFGLMLGVLLLTLFFIGNTHALSHWYNQLYLH